MLSNRDDAFVDIRKCPSKYLDDWWWQNEIGAKRLVVPTDKFVFLPENYDKDALHLQPNLRTIRESYFQKWLKNV